METQCFRKRHLVLATLVMSIMLTLLFTTVVRAENYFTDAEREQYYKDLIEFMGEYVDPGYHLREESYVTSEQREILRQVAQELTKDCTTDYEKMRAIANYAADNFYYDYVYLQYGGAVAYRPYDVYMKKTTVCEGYANFCQEMLYLVDIPCMSLIGDNHKFNAAYDQDSKRWVIIDSTWMSTNQRWLNDDGTDEWNKGLMRWDEWFDATPYILMNNTNHEIFGLNGIVIGDYVYSMSFTFEYGDFNWISSKASIAVDMVNNAIVDAVLPEEFLGQKVSAYYLSFHDFANLRSVVIPVAYKELYDNCFNGCKNLESVVFKGVPEYIGGYCFRDCTSLKEITLPRGIKSIEYGTFYGCTALKEIEIPEGVTYIDSDAFAYCTSLEKIIIPDSVTEIGAYVFYGVDTNKLVIYCHSGSYAEEYAKKNRYKYVIVNDYTGLQMVDGKLVYMTHSEFDATYTGIAEYKGEQYFVLRGEVDTTYTGIRSYNGEFYAVWNGKFNPSYTGLQNNAGTFWYIVDGKVATDYVGLYENNVGIWYIQGGKIDVNFTGLANYEDEWICIKNGRYYPNYTGMVKNAGAWWYIENGSLNSFYNGLYTNDGGTWLVKGGRIFAECTGLFQIDGLFYYVIAGRAAINYTGFAKHNGVFWYIEDGTLRELTGIVDTPIGKWYLIDGRLNNITGNLTIDGVKYTFDNGRVVKESK